MSDKILVEYTTNVDRLNAEFKEIQSDMKSVEKTGVDSAKKVGDEFKKTEDKAKSLKAQLRELKAQLASATDPKEVERLAKAAGKLTDQLEDASDAARVFASESKFEQVGNALGSIGSKLRNLDFKGAADQSKLLVSATKSITFKEALGGVKDLGATLLNIGKSLLMNPIFLIGAAITFIITNFDKLASSGGIVGKMFKGIGEIVGAVKDGFLRLTDAIGLTDTAANEAAENIQNAYAELAEKIGKQYDRIIKITKSAGKQTVDIERQKAIALANNNEKQYRAYRDNLIRQGKTLDDLSDEELAKLKEFGDKKADLLSENEALYRAKKKADDDKAIAAQKEYNEKLLQLAKDLRDLQANAIEDGRARELQQLDNSYADQRLKYKDNAEILKQLEVNYRIDRLKIVQKYDALELEAKNKYNAEIKAGISQNAKNTTAIFKAALKENTKADEEYTEEQFEQMRLRAQMEKDIQANRVAYIKSALDSIQQISNNITQKRLDEVSTAATKEQEILENQYNTGVISRQEYDRKVTESKKKEEEEAKKIQLAAFKRNKQLSLINVAISTAESIAKTISTYPLPLGAPLVAINAALGALQIAAIASQPTPKFAKGGKVGGRLHSEGGTLIEAERDEWIIKRNESIKNDGLLEAINKGKGQKYIHEVYVAPALKEQIKKHSQSKDSSFAQNIAQSMLFNSGKLNDGNILESLKMQRKADKENIKYLAKVISQNNYNARNW